MSSETRSSNRKHVSLLLKLKHENVERFVEEWATNVSETGMFVRSKSPPAVGTNVAFEVRLAKDIPVLKGTAVVRWTRGPGSPTEPPAGMGLEFTSLEEAARRLIQRMVAVKQMLEAVSPQVSPLTPPPGYEPPPAPAPSVAPVVPPVAPPRQAPPSPPPAAPSPAPTTAAVAPSVAPLIPPVGGSRASTPAPRTAPPSAPAAPSRPPPRVAPVTHFPSAAAPAPASRPSPAPATRTPAPPPPSPAAPPRARPAPAPVPDEDPFSLAFDAPTAPAEPPPPSAPTADPAALFSQPAPPPRYATASTHAAPTPPAAPELPPVEDAFILEDEPLVPPPAPADHVDTPLGELKALLADLTGEPPPAEDPDDPLALAFSQPTAPPRPPAAASASAPRPAAPARAPAPPPPAAAAPLPESVELDDPFLELEEVPPAPTASAADEDEAASRSRRSSRGSSTVQEFELDTSDTDAPLMLEGEKPGRGQRARPAPRPQAPTAAPSASGSTARASPAAPAAAPTLQRQDSAQPTAPARAGTKTAYLPDPGPLRSDGPVIGIDLGTTNSCVAALVNGKPTVLRTREGQSTLPSVISLANTGKLLIGHRAKGQQLLNPQSTIYGAKRLVGREFDSAVVSEVRGRFLYDICADDAGRAAVKLGPHVVSLEEVQGIILKEWWDPLESTCRHASLSIL